MSEWHKHVQAPEDPEDGDEIRCQCGYVAVFTVLDDGLPGEWMQTEGD